MIEVIPFSDFQIAISPMWGIAPQQVSIYNNPYGIFKYPVPEQRDSVLYFPIRFVEDGVVKGYSSIYNVSDTVLRLRGIYILPEFRGSGAGHRMIAEMAELFPITFHRVIGFMREGTVDRFMRHSRMAPLPQSDWIWSEFSQINMRCLYRDRGTKPTETIRSREFIKEQSSRYGFGGTNNLNRNWTDTEWLEFTQIHKGNYPDLGLNLDF